MQRSPAIPLNDEAVYVRTPAGQREALYGHVLDDTQRRFLLLVNGYTPLRTLVDMCGLGGNLIQIMRALVASGFIEPVDPAMPHLLRR